MLLSVERQTCPYIKLTGHPTVYVVMSTMIHFLVAPLPVPVMNT